jgi:hypothetical protein
MTALSRCVVDTLNNIIGGRTGMKQTTDLRRPAYWLLLVVLALAPAFASAATLIAKGSSWSYLDNGSDQGTAWRAKAFNEASWASGPAQLGYGDGGEATLVSYGPNSSAKYITTYFRRHFQVADPSKLSSLTLNLLRDDGAVVYLNGTEVLRSNMPAGAVGFRTVASTAIGGSAESAFSAATVPTSSLVAGDNVIAVEIHQSSGTSSDISFDLELVGNEGSTGSAQLKRGPYLQIGTPTGVVVRWRTNVATNSRVRVGTDPANLNLTFDDVNVASTEHEVQVSGLTPQTKYYYSIGSTTQTLTGGDSNTFFETSPAAGTAGATRVWVIGDAGTATAGARAVYNAYRNFTGTTHTNLWLMLGDNAYTDGTDAQYQTAVFDFYPELLRKTVVWPTLGNHDGHSANSATQSGPYYDIFTLPKRAEAGGVASGTEAYYSFNHGNIHFVVLDSYDSSRAVGSPMLNWLKADLQSTTAQWIIAFWHHPPYSKGTHDSDNEAELAEMRRNVLPIMESYGVDLVLSGHSHAYERSKFIDGHYGTSSTFSDSAHVKVAGSGRVDGTGAYTKGAGLTAHAGAVYAVAGSSGKTEGGALNHPAMYVSLNELGSMVLDINGATLDAKFLNNNGTTRDYFTIKKGGGGGGGGGGDPQTQTVNLQAGLNGYAGAEDTYIASGQPGTNFGSAAALLADGADGTNGRMASLLKWNVSSIPATATVTDVRIALSAFNASAGTYNVYASNAVWTAGSATWSSVNPLGTVGTLIGTFTPAPIGNVSIQLNAAGIALVQSWVKGTAVNNGIVVMDAGTTDGTDFRSSEYGVQAERPKLTVVYR